MTPQTTLGLIFLILTITPIIYFGRIAKNRSLKAKVKLLEKTREQSITLDETDHWNDKCLGISREFRMLFFENLDPQNLCSRAIDLSDYRRCNVSVKKLTIELILEPRKSSDANYLYVEIFNTRFDSSTEVGFHHQKAIKWSKVVQQVIDQKPTPLRKSA